MNQLIGLGQNVVRLFNRFVIALLVVLTLTTAASAQQFAIGSYHQQSAVRVTTTQYDYTYTADLTNNGSAATGVVGTVTSSSPNTLVMKSTVNFGSVGASGTITSTDTFVIRQDRRFTFDPSSLLWVFTSAQPPTANAGPNQTAHIGDTVTLNGTASTDPNGKPLTYLWAIFSAPSGSSATITAATSPMPTLRVDVAGNYVIHLVVNNGNLNSSPSSVTISTSHTAPTAHAGSNQTGSVGTLIQLDGSTSVDPDGNSLTYAWSIFSAPTGSTATLSSTTAVKPSFTIDKFGTYVLQLVVSDQFLSSTPSQVTITTAHTPPVANAGPSQSATVGSTVTLSGSLSSDVDGFPLTYSWSLTSAPKGSNAALNLSTTAHPNFVLDVAGTYVAQLIVNDGFNSSSPGTVTISTELLAPVANAGPNQEAQLQQLVHLDGTGSTDPNNLSLTYLWSFLARPANSASSLSSTTAPQPTFTPDVHGTYVVQLVVNNGTFNSTPATVTIDVPAPTPVANAGADQTVAVGSTVSLNGLASSDSEGNPLSYLWSFTSTPGTAPALNGATTATPAFVPTAAGNYVLQLVVNNGFNSSAPATIQITVVTPSASVPASLMFSDQAIGTSSASRSVTFTNTGAAPISISSVGATGDFSNQLASGCGSTVAVGGNCSISVVFSPTAIGARTGTLSIFDNIPGSPQTVSLSGNGIAGAASKLVFSVQPSTVAVGSSISPAVTVTVEDAGGNVVTTATNSVTIAIGTNPGSGTLGGLATVNAINGVATFSNLSLSSVGTGYTLAASSAGLTGAASNPFNVTAGAASKLVFSVQPSTVAVGSSISPAVTVTVEDAGGNVVTSATNAVTIAIGTNPGSGTLGGLATVNAINGVATFSNLSLSSVGAGYTLAASSAGLTSATSGAFNVTAGSASKLVFSVQPSTVAVGSSISPVVTVTVEDVSGNVVTTATNSVTIAIGANPGSGTLGGTATVNAISGVATFSNLSLSSVGTGYKLAASSAGLTSATSGAFNVTAGSASKLVFSVQPSTVAVGSSISPVVKVTVEDAGGNVVTTATNSVTIAIGTNPGSGTLGGLATVNAINGVATFSNLSLSSVGTGYTLAASSAGLTGAASNPFNVTAGAASKLVFSVQPSTVAVGSSISPAVTVTVEDAGGNVVTSATNAVTIAIGTNPGSGTLGGLATVNAINGVATFSNLSLSSVGAGYTLAASSAGLTSATSGAFNVTAGSASKLVFSVQPSTVAVGSSISPVVTVTVEDVSGNVVTTATNSVTIAIGANPGSGTLGGTATVNAVSGVATFSNLSLSSVGTGYKLAASSAGLTGTTSGAFNVTAGAASKLVFSVQPSTVAVGSSISPVVKVTVEDAGGNVVTTATNSVTIAIGTNPGSGTLGGLATVNAINGVATFSNLSLSNVGTGYTLAASSAGLTGATSGTFNVTAGAASKLVFSVQPSTVAVGSSISPAVTVTVEDAGGNVVTTATNAVTIAIGTNPGSGTLGGLATVNAINGVATFSNLSLSSVGTGYTLAASSAGLTGATSGTFNVTAGAASKLVFSVQPSTVAVGSSISPAVTVTIEDAGGNVVTTATNAVTIAIGTNPGSGTLGGLVTANAINGVATFSNLSLSSVGTGYTVAASSAGLTGATSGTFNVTAGAASKLVFSVQPSTVAVGSSISPAVTVTVEDAGGNVVTTATNAVTIAIGTNPGSGTLGGLATVNAINGVATFSNLSLSSVGTGYTLAASSAGLTGTTSGAFNVTAGAASKLVFSVQPSTVTVGSSISPAVTVTVEDAGGNVVTTATNSVTIAIGTNPGSGTLGGLATVNAINGVATFSNLSLNSVGTGYTLAASSAGLTGTTSGTFNVTAGAASKLVFSVQPSTAAVGSSISPAVTVTVEDAGGNVVTTATNAVTIAIGTNPGSGTLGGLATVNAINGVATFSNLSLSSVGTGYTLAASSAGLTSATSGTFNVTAGAASKLVFSVQPSAVAVGSSISPAVTVTVEDAGGNVVTTATNSVTIAIGTNPGSGTLGGLATVNAVNGVATFSNLSLSSAGTGYTLAASSAGLTGATSGTFNVTAGAASKLVFSVQPSNTLAGAAITPAVTVTIEDVGGNTVTTANNAVTLALASNPGSGTLSGTATVNAVNGVATFSNLSLSSAGTGYTLAASSAGLTSATSGTFNVTAGAASKLVFSVQPSNTLAGAAITPAIKVTVEDAVGNTVTTANNAVTLALASNPGSGTLSGTATVNAVNGVATFSNLSLSSAGTGYTLAASSAGLTSATSGTFNVTAGAASKLVFSVQPSNTLAGAAITPAIKVTVEDAVGNTVTTANNAVTLALASNPGSGTLSGTATVNAVNGVATFSNLSLSSAGTGYTLAASSAGLTGATSGTFNVTAGAASKLVFSVQPSNTLAGAAITPAVTVTIEDAGGNTVTTANNAVTLALASNPGSGTLSGTLTANAVNGVASFAGLNIDQAGTGYTLSASTAGLTPGVSGTFNITGFPITVTVPSSLVGIGSPLSGSFTLAQAAPAGGIVVTLSSSNTAAVTISPATVSVLQGQTTGAFSYNGVTTGTAILSASAPGYITGTTTVTATSQLISLGAVSNITVGQTGSLPLSLGTNAPAGGVTVNLTSSNPGFATITASVFIPAGSKIPSANPQITGVAPGSTQITATASGFAPNNESVTIIAPTASLAPSPVSAHQTIVTAVTLTISAPAPAGGTTFTLSTDNSAIATVQSPVTIAQGSTSTSVNVTGVGIGSTTLRADSTGIVEAIDTVNVTAAPTISFPVQSVGNNMVAGASASLSAAPSSNETLTLTSNDPTHFLLSTTQSAVGSSSITLQLTAGSTGIPQFFIQGQNLSGTTSITGTVTTTAPGYANGTGTLTLLPTGLYLSSPTITTTTFSTNTTVNVGVAVLSSGTLTFAATGTLGPQAAPISVSLDNSDTSVGTVLGSPATIAIGGSSAGSQLSFKPLTAGTTTLTLTQPSGYNVPSNKSQQVAVTITAPAITISSPTVGNNMVAGTSGSLGAAPPSNETLTLTSNDPTHFLLSTTQSAVGSSSITLQLTAGSAGIPTFFIDGQNLSGTTSITGTITATASGYTDGTGTLTLLPTGLYLSSPTINTTTFSTNTTVNVNLAVLNSGSLTFAGSGILGPQAVPISVSLGNSNTAVGTVLGSPATIAIGSSNAGTQLSFKPLTAGTTTLTLTQPSGYNVVSGQAQQVAVTVTAPAITISSPLLGNNMVAGTSGSLGAAPPSNETLTLTSNDPTHFLLSTTQSAVGSSSITLQLTAGSTGIPTFFIDGQNLSGTTSITGTVTATASGYTNATLTLTLLPTGLYLSSPTINTTTFSANTTVNVAVAVLNSGSLTFAGNGILGPQATPISVSLGNSNTAVGTVLGSPATIAIGGSSAGTQLSFKPLTAGTTTLTLTQPSGYNVVNGQAQQVAVTVTAPAINISSPTVGNNMVAGTSGSLGAAPPSNETLTLTSNDPTHFLLSTSQSTIGSASITLQLTAGSTGIPTFFVDGQNLSGTTSITGTVTATASGYTNATLTLTLLPTGLYLSSPTITTTTSSANTNVNVAVAVLNSASLTFVGNGILGPQATPISVSLGNSNTAVGTVLGSPATIAIGATNTASQLSFKPLTAGTTTLTLTQPSGYNVVNGQAQQVAVTVNP